MPRAQIPEPRAQSPDCIGSIGILLKARLSINHLGSTLYNFVAFCPRGKPALQEKQRL